METNTSLNNYPEPLSETGLTKREYFAALAMQGLLSCDPMLSVLPENASKFAVKQADALIKELNK